MKTQTIKDLQFKNEVIKKRNHELEPGNSPFVKPSGLKVDSMLINAFSGFEWQEGNNIIDLLIPFNYASINYHLEIKTSISIWRDGTFGDWDGFNVEITKDDDELEFVHASYDDLGFDKWFKGYIEDLFDS